MDGNWYSDQELMQAQELLKKLAEARSLRDEARVLEMLHLIQHELGWLMAKTDDALPPPFLQIKAVLLSHDPSREDGKAERKGAK